MAYDARWNVWLKSSMLTHLKAVLTPFPVFIEAMPRKQLGPAYFEARFGGVIANEQGKNHWRLRSELNVLCIAHIVKNGYDINVLLGRALDALSNSIAVYDDNGSQVGCLELVETNKRSIEGHEFGQVEPKVLQMQASAQATYEIYLEAT